MTARPRDALGGVAALVLPLAVWRQGYRLSDWAALGLMVLAVLLVWGWWPPARRRALAELAVALRPGSALSRVLRGRVGPTLGAVALAVVAVPVLAWQAVSAAPPVLAALTALALVAAAGFNLTRGWLARHLTEPFVHLYALHLASWAAALAFLPLLVWLEWSQVPHPGALADADLMRAMQIALDELPPRRGLIAELLAPFHALDGAMLWLTVKLSDYRVAGLIYSLNAALVAFVVARAAAVLTGLAGAVGAAQGGRAP